MNSTGKMFAAVLCCLLSVVRRGHACLPPVIWMSGYSGPVDYVSPGEQWQLTAFCDIGGPIKDWWWTAGGSPFSFTWSEHETYSDASGIYYDLGGWYVYAYGKNYSDLTDWACGTVWVFQMDANIGLPEGTEENPGKFLAIGDTATLTLRWDPGTLWQCGQTQELAAIGNYLPQVKVYQSGTLIIDATDTKEIWTLVSRDQTRTVTVEACNPGSVMLEHRFRTTADGYPGSANRDKVKVTVVGVNQIDMRPSPTSGWYTVSGTTITLLKGTKPTCQCGPYPTNAPWPSGWPKWYLNGTQIGADGATTVEVPFDSGGTKTLVAKCGSADPGKSVTINVVAPSLYQFGVSGDQTLYPTPDANSANSYAGWADANTAQFMDPIYDSDVGKNCPICVVKNSNTVSLSGVILRISQPPYPTWATTIRIDASGTEEWNESGDISFTGAPSSGATLPITGNIINCVTKYDDESKFQIEWKYKVTSGTNTWHSLGTTQHDMYVTYGVPQPQGLAVTEQRIKWLCDTCNGATEKLECSDAIYYALYDHNEPPQFELEPDPNYPPTNRWWMMDPNGPKGNCSDLAYLMEAMYHLLGCTGGEQGYIYATSDSTCYSTDPESNDPLVFEYHTCSVHGGEELVFWAAGGYNTFEAVFYVNNRYYAVKETVQATALDVLRDILGDNTLEGGSYQVWLSPNGECANPGPRPQPLPSP